MGKTRKNKKEILKYSSITLLIVFLLGAALIALNLWEKQQGKFPASEFDNSIEYNGKRYVPRDGIETFLAIGLDKFATNATNGSYNNNKQADFLMLFVFDNKAEKCTAVHINRDTMASINVLGISADKINTVTQQIALAHTYGDGEKTSCSNTADAVSKLFLGMNITHYISFTLDAVPALNDLVGGVEVTVTDDFTGIDETLVKGETVTLLGEHALNYVRIRYGLEDSSNSTRMERQRQYLQALYEKMSKSVETDNEFIFNATKKIEDYIVSDRSVTQLQELGEKFSKYDFEEIRYIEGESKLGEEYMEFYADADSIEKTVIDLFYKPKD